MKKVSLRDFQLKPSKYFKDLPIVLTRYGEPIAQVVPLKGLSGEVVKEVSKDFPIEEKPKIKKEITQEDLDKAREEAF